MSTRQTLIICLVVTAACCQALLDPYNFEASGNSSYAITSPPTPVWDSGDNRYESTVGISTLTNDYYYYHLVKDGEAPSAANKFAYTYSSVVGNVQVDGQRAGDWPYYRDTYVLVNVSVETTL